MIPAITHFSVVRISMQWSFLLILHFEPFTRKVGKTIPTIHRLLIGWTWIFENGRQDYQFPDDHPDHSSVGDQQTHLYGNDHQYQLSANIYIYIYPYLTYPDYPYLTYPDSYLFQMVDADIVVA